VRRIGGIPHFEYVLAFVGGLTLGTWIDAIIMGTEGASIGEIRCAGRESRSRKRSHSNGIE
jgi:hypothetical protein